LGGLREIKSLERLPSTVEGEQPLADGARQGCVEGGGWLALVAQLSYGAPASA
jgi:hypothetical protein